MWLLLSRKPDLQIPHGQYQTQARLLCWTLTRSNALHFYQCPDSSAVWWNAVIFPGNCAKVTCVLDRPQNWENAVGRVHRAFRYPVPHELAYIWDTSALLFLMQSQRPLPNAQYTQSLPGSSGKGEGKLGSWHGIRLLVKSFYTLWQVFWTIENDITWPLLIWKPWGSGG